MVSECKAWECVDLTCLRDGDQVLSVVDCWDSVLLDRSGLLVSDQVNDLHHVGMKTSIFECMNQVDMLGSFDHHVVHAVLVHVIALLDTEFVVEKHVLELRYLQVGH